MRKENNSGMNKMSKSKRERSDSFFDHVSYGGKVTVAVTSTVGVLAMFTAWTIVQNGGGTSEAAIRVALLTLSVTITITFLTSFMYSAATVKAKKMKDNY